MIRPAALFLVSLFLFAPPVHSYTGIQGIGVSGFSFPGPELLSPATEDIDLTGKDCLEFKWRVADFVPTSGYIFKLYKGYDTVAANLILRQEIGTNTYPVRILVSQFRGGQVYTWALIQVLYTGSKSDASCSSFKVIKK